jgi:hypothetical protein
MPRVRFEPTTPVFQRAKTVYALDRVATVIGFRLQNAMALVPVEVGRHSRKYRFGPCLII